MDPNSNLKKFFGSKAEIMKTKGDGNCFFHAISGSHSQEFLIWDNIKTERANIHKELFIKRNETPYLKILNEIVKKLMVQDTDKNATGKITLSSKMRNHKEKYNKSIEEFHTQRKKEIYNDYTLIKPKKFSKLLVLIPTDENNELINKWKEIIKKEDWKEMKKIKESGIVKELIIKRSSEAYEILNPNAPTLEQVSSINENMIIDYIESLKTDKKYTEFIDIPIYPDLLNMIIMVCDQRNNQTIHTFKPQIVREDTKKVRLYLKNNHFERIRVKDNSGIDSIEFDWKAKSDNMQINGYCIGNDTLNEEKQIYLNEIEGSLFFSESYHPKESILKLEKKEKAYSAMSYKKEILLNTTPMEAGKELSITHGSSFQLTSTSITNQIVIIKVQYPENSPEKMSRKKRVLSPNAKETTPLKKQLNLQENRSKKNPSDLQILDPVIQENEESTIEEAENNSATITPNIISNNSVPSNQMRECSFLEALEGKKSLPQKKNPPNWKRFVRIWIEKALPIEEFKIVFNSIELCSTEYWNDYLKNSTFQEIKTSDPSVTLCSTVYIPVERNIFAERMKKRAKGKIFFQDDKTKLTLNSKIIKTMDINEFIKTDHINKVVIRLYFKKGDTRKMERAEDVLIKSEGYLGKSRSNKSDSEVIYYHFSTINKIITDACYNLDKTRKVHPQINGIRFSFANDKRICGKCGARGHNNATCTEYFQQKVMEHGKFLKHKDQKLFTTYPIYTPPSNFSKIFLRKTNGKKFPKTQYVVFGARKDENVLNTKEDCTSKIKSNFIDEKKKLDEMEKNGMIEIVENLTIKNNQFKIFQLDHLQNSFNQFLEKMDKEKMRNKEISLMKSKIRNLHIFHLINVEEKEDIKMKFHFIESLFEVYKEKEAEEEIAQIEPNIPQNMQANRRRGREEHPPREEQKKKQEQLKEALLRIAQFINNTNEIEITSVNDLPSTGDEGSNSPGSGCLS